jgi:hypothetical protein
MQKNPAFCWAGMLCLVLNIFHAQTAVGSPAKTNASQQDSTGIPEKISNFPDRVFNRINRKVSSLDMEIDKRTEIYVKRMMNDEGKLRKEFTQIDSSASNSLFLCDAKKQYTDLLVTMNAETPSANKIIGQYLPTADSLQVSLSFLKVNPQLLSDEYAELTKSTLARIQQLQGKLNEDELIRQFIVQRKEQIGQYLSLQKYIPESIKSIYADYNKQLYYYSQQLNEFKQIWNDPDKLLSTAFRLLNKLPAFTSFMNKNSFLAGIFDAAGDGNMDSCINGMQTRNMIDEKVQGQITAGGESAASAFSSGLQSAQGALDQIKDKISSLGQGSEHADLPPGFTPNNQKTKTFWRRLELGANLQTSRTSAYYPNVLDLGISLGYRVNDKSTVGLGSSFKMGLGNDIRHVAVTASGASLRSFLDIQIRGGFSATGGLEYNHTAALTSFQDIRQLNEWTASGLIGVSKTISVQSRVFKKTTVTLLWDFLSYQQVPRTQPVIFRIGYGFN